MGLDPVKNFAKSTLASGIASGVTSLSVASGDGSKFPQPSTDGAFNAIIWNSTDYPNPSDDPNKEIVRVTARTTDALTIVRAQEGTSDSNHNTGGKTYSIILAMTAKMISDIDSRIAITDILYADLVTAIGANGLVKGALYRITDFATKHYIVDGYGNKIKQVDTVTLTGTSGTANVTGAGGLTKLATFNTDLGTTASDFVTAFAADYLAQGIVVTSNGANLIFTAKLGGIGFTNPVITNVSGDLAGTVANTQVNDGVITGATEPLIVMAIDVDKLDKQAYSQTYPQDIIYYDWNPANWMDDLSFADAESLPATAIISGFKGVIYFRHDTLLDNYMGYDFRAVKFRRWKTNAGAWSNTTTYGVGDFVEYSGYVYRSLKAGNLNKTPSSGSNYWTQCLDLGYTLYWNAAPGSWNNIISGTDYTDAKTFAEGSGTATYELCCRSNHFKSFKDSYTYYDISGTLLMNNVFWLQDEAYYTVYSNEIEAEFFANTIGNNFFANTIGNAFYSNTIVDYFYFNTIGNYFNSNTIGYNFNSNTIGNAFYSNTIGLNFGSNTIGNGFNSNTIGNNFNYNTIGYNFNSNTIGNNFNYNTIGNYFTLNTNIADNFQRNKVEDDFNYNGTLAMDFATATYVYTTYNKELYRREDGTQKLRYYNNSDVLVVVAANA